MDEIEYKLKTNTSVFVVNAIDKLISTIQSKFKPAEKKKFAMENEELKFLRDKCSSENKLVSLTACQGLLALVEMGVLEIGHTMSTVVTLLPTAHNYSAIISTMAGLLILDLRLRLIPGQPYVCQFSLRSPQHPFITVLVKNSKAEDEVLAQMHALCTHPDYVVSSNALELLRPVLVWLTCNPERRSIKPWRLLLSLSQTPALFDILIQCLSCQQICNPSQIDHAFAAYQAVTEQAVYQQNREMITALLPMLARISNRMVVYGHDPRPCYSLMSRCTCADAPHLRSAVSLTLMLLADNLPVTPANYLHELNTLCLNIISKYEYSLISLNVFVALSLQWLHLPSYLTAPALKVAAKILETHRNDPKDDTRFHTANLKSNKTFEALLHTDSRLSLVFKLNQTWERIRDDPDKLRSWLSSLERIDDSLKLELAPFLMGIILINRKETWWEEICVKVLNILIGLVNARKDISVQILPLLLYKVGDDKSPQVRWLCLKALPLMAITKENVPTIVAVLNKLKANKTLPTSFLMMLYTSLAETQVRCFPYLQEVLSEHVPTRPDELKADVEIARAVAVKRICDIRPTTQGVELVGVLSSTLNRCTDKTLAVAARVALLALAALWKGAGVAPAPAWRAVEGRVSRDNRVHVQLGTCALLSSVPLVRTSSPDFPALARSAAGLLWGLLARGEARVVEAAALALRGYRLDDYTLRDIPEIYRRTVKLPASYCKTPADAARDPVDVLDYIPCEIWPEVFKYTNQAALPAVEGFVGKLCEREVKSYRSGVYQVEPGREPSLPPHSVVRGLMEFLRKQSLSPSYDAPATSLLSILRCLSLDGPRALPPFDVTFLHTTLEGGGEGRRLAGALAARQAPTCGPARRLAENWIRGLLDNVEETDILHFFEILPMLCRTMPPNSIRPPLEKFLGEAYNDIANIKITDSKVKVENNESEEYLFIRHLQMLSRCLDNDRIHDANRTLIAQIVENYFTVISDDNVSWDAYVSLASRLPAGVLERMTSPSSWWEPSRDLLYRSAAVRGQRGLAGLDQLLDAAPGHVPDTEDFLRLLVKPLQATNVNDKSTVQWFLQLMARTQVGFTETSDPSTRLYLFSLFCLSAGVFSQLYVLDAGAGAGGGDAGVVRTCLSGEMMAASVAELVKKDHWRDITLQVVEWLRHTRDTMREPAASLACQRALLALRDTPPFIKHHIWITLDKHFSKTSLNANE